MWEVATIDWGTKEVIPIVNKDGESKVIPNYINPNFYQ